jgi:hypothetical protein
MEYRQEFLGPDALDAIYDLDCILVRLIDDE